MGGVAQYEACQMDITWCLRVRVCTRTKAILLLSRSQNESYQSVA